MHRHSAAAGIAGADGDRVRPAGRPTGSSSRRRRRAADGTYDLGGLPGGDYTLGFSDPASGITEFWNDKAALADAPTAQRDQRRHERRLDARSPRRSRGHRRSRTPTPTPTPTETPTPTTPTPTVDRDHDGDPTATPTAPAAAAPTAVRAVSVVKMPKIKGFAKVDQRLRVTKGAWNPTAVKRKVQWMANGKKIKGATKMRLRLTSKLVGKKITVKMTASAPGHDQA